MVAQGYMQPTDREGNLQRLKQTLAADKELAGYKEMFLWGNEGNSLAPRPIFPNFANETTSKKYEYH